MSKETFDTILGIVNILILCITAYFMYRSLRSPIDAVKVGRQLNNEEQKDNTKRELFLTLFALRGNPIHFDFVTGLNEIDVVFEDNPAVLSAWHKHFRDLHDKGLTDPLKMWEVGRIELLSVMATSLGYNALKQTEIMQHYYPEGHNTQWQDSMDLQEANLIYLKSGVAFHEAVLESLNKLPPLPPTEPKG